MEPQKLMEFYKNMSKKGSFIEQNNLLNKNGVIADKTLL